MKKPNATFLNLFFLILTLFLVKNTLTGEVFFIMRILYVFGLLSLFVIIYYSYRRDYFTTNNILRKLFLFLFLSIAFFSLRQTSIITTVSRINNLTNGTILFVNYIFFIILLKPKVETNSYLALLFLTLVPISILAKINYSTEIFASFAFLLLFIIIIQLTSQLYVRSKTV